MKVSSEGFGSDKEYQHFTKSGKKLYKAIEYLKKKWNGTPITKGTLLSMLQDAYKMGFEKAVVFAKKKQDKYNKDALLVYRKNPISITNPSAMFDIHGKLYSMYIMLPNETPPQDVEYRPNSECVFQEQEVPLKDPKELGRRIVEIIKALEYTPLAKPDPIPKAPPSENYMYFFDKKDPEKFNPATPVSFVPAGAYENTYKSSGWHGTVNGVQIQPVDPHSACYYEIMCCGQKPSPDAKVVIKNYFKKRSSYFFKLGSVGIINPLLFVSKSQNPSGPNNPPTVRLPVYPVPGPGRYPVPKIKVPGYKIDIKARPQNPQRRKPLTTGGQGGVTLLGGRKFDSMRSYEMNRGRYGIAASNSVRSGNGLNTRKKARTNNFNRGAWYNNQGVLGRRTALKVSGGEPEIVIDETNATGLIPTADLPFFRIDVPTTRTGLATARERITQFKEENNVVTAYGWYYTDPGAPPFDIDFGSVATQQYVDNVFFYPYDNKFGNDTFIDFFVKFKGDAVKLSPTGETDFYFAIIGQNDTTQPVFLDTLGTGKQSVGIANSPNHVIIEVLMRHENVNPTTGILFMQIRAVDGTGAVVAPAVNVNTFTSDIINGEPLHVRLRLQTSGLGTPAGQAILSNDFIVKNKRYTIGPFLAPLIANNITEFTKLAFGYIDYDAPALAINPLSGRIPPLSAGANLTGLQLSDRRIPRKYVWDYTYLG